MAYYYNLDFLDQCVGKGVSLIHTFDYNEKSGEWETNVTAGEEKLHDSIRNILSTRVGERFFMPEFGSKLYRVLYEQNTLIARDMVIDYTREALSKWEKRIVVDDVEVSDTEDKNNGNVLPITIYYHYKNSNVNGSYVYPFNLGDDGTISTYSMQYDTFQ